VGDPTQQDHDWEPGIAPSGLFWTIPIDDKALHVEPGAGKARYRLTGVPVLDFHDGISAVVGGGPDPVPAHVSFEVRWAGKGEKRKIRDETFGFAGHYVTGPSTITFSARNDASDVVYTSDPGGQYNPPPEQGGAGSPAVGHEKNGIFFH
jgi:hypothetical protein